MKPIWKTHSSFLAIATIFVTLTAVAAPTLDCSLLLEDHLADDQIDAIHRVNANAHYNLQILAKDIDGRKKLIVAVGESHFKHSPEEARVGVGLLKAFSFQGSEGGRPPTLGEKLKKHFQRLNPYYTESQIDEERIQRFREYIAKNPSAIDNMRGSTTFYTDLFATGDKVEVMLERGLKIPASMQIRSLYLPIRICIGMISCSTFVGSYFANDLSTNLELKAAAFAILAADVGAVFLPMSTRFQRLVRKLNILEIFDEDSGILRDRNVYMANSINQAILDYPDRDVMLVIVGREHVFSDAQPEETLPAFLEKSGWAKLNWSSSR